MQTVKTLSGETIRLFKNKTAEKSVERYYSYVTNEDIRKAYRTKSEYIDVFAHKGYAEPGEPVQYTYFNGKFDLQFDGEYAIGCKRFSQNAFNVILRNAGALRQYTRKAKAAKAGK